MVRALGRLPEGDDSWWTLPREPSGNRAGVYVDDGVAFVQDSGVLEQMLSSLQLGILGTRPRKM